LNGIKRAFSPTEILKMKKKIIQLGGAWHDAFGNIERSGVIFIWGNSGNGKSSFVMQFCKELAKFGRVIYNSLEEGVGYTMQSTLDRFGMSEADRHLLLVGGESAEELSERLLRRKSADFIVIDSFQYFQISYKNYLKFKELHKDKLLIFISHADGKYPAGRTARSVMFDSMLKIWVEGYRAFSKGRFIGELGYYNVWAERAAEYWGKKETEHEED
jgi:KaiC/GvpD/RAD55 family RecA-like ATPase